MADEVWELVLKGIQQAPKAVGLYALPVPMCLEDAQERDVELGCLVSCDCRTLSVEASGASLTSLKNTSSSPAHCHYLLWAFSCLAGHYSPVPVCSPAPGKAESGFQNSCPSLEPYTGPPNPRYRRHRETSFSRLFSNTRQRLRGLP